MVNATLYDLGFTLLIIGIILVIVSFFIGRGGNDEGGGGGDDDGDGGGEDGETPQEQVTFVVHDDQGQPVQGVTIHHLVTRRRFFRRRTTSASLGQTDASGMLVVHLAPGDYTLYLESPNNHYREHQQTITVRAHQNNQFLFTLQRNYHIAYDYAPSSRPPRRPGEVYDLFAVLIDPVSGNIASHHTEFILETSHGDLYEVPPGTPDPLDPSRLGRNLGPRAQLPSEADRAFLRFALLYDQQQDVQVTIRTNNPQDGVHHIPCPYRHASPIGPGTIRIEYIIGGRTVPSLIPGSPSIVRITTDDPAGFHPQPGDEIYLVDAHGNRFEEINIPAILNSYLVNPQTYEIPMTVPAAGSFTPPLYLHYHLS